jgi:hypothetical protein
MKRLFFVASFSFLFVLNLSNPEPTHAQASQSLNSARLPNETEHSLKSFVATPAISGYENELAEEIRAEISPFHPKTDNLGDVIVTIGSGAPNRLKTVICVYNAFRNPACLLFSTNCILPNRSGSETRTENGWMR